jgi:hypothetical protein
MGKRRRAAITREINELLAAAGEVARGVGGGALVERPRHDLDVLALFDRCRSTLGAIHLLLLEGFVHEAVLLGRPLFTESLMLAELASVDPTRRAELVVGWQTAGLASFRGMVLEARSSGDDVTDELVRLDARKAELERYAARLGVRTRAWKPNEKALADAHGRSDEYSAFRLAHHFVHGSALAASQRYSTIADDTAAVGGPAAQLDPWATDGALFAVYSLLHACRAACRIFDWPEPPQLQRLLDRVDGILASRSSELADEE